MQFQCTFFYHLLPRIHLNVRRKYIGIFLLAIISFQAAGYVIAYRLWQLKIQHDVKWAVLKGLPDAELSIIKIPQEPLQSDKKDFQMEDGNEFRYRNEMYDIVRTEIHNDTTWFYAFRDRDETRLLSSLASSVGKHIDQDPKAHQQSSRFLNISLLSYILISLSEHDAFYHRLPYYDCETLQITELPLLKTSPPPKS